MRLKIYPYKQGSKSAKKLAEVLGCKVLKTQGSKYRPQSGDVVINWGSGHCPYTIPTVLNKSDAIGRASNKLTAFRRFKEAGVSIPEFWTSKEEVPTDGTKIVARTNLSGHSGAGIVIWDGSGDLVSASLYTKYIKKADEFRIHVMKDKAFFIQRKARKIAVENPNWEVRNLEGGFVYVAHSLDDVPDEAKENAVRSIIALGLDFGAVDLIHGRDGKWYILEVNTACGLEDRTAEKYKEAFHEHYSIL